MVVFPNFTVSKLPECARRDLVRTIDYASTGSFAFVADIASNDTSEEREIAVVELGIEGAHYFIPKHPEELYVACYGQDYVIQVDQRKNFTVQDSGFRDECGCLVRTESAWLLNVRPSRGSFYGRRTRYDVESGILGAPIGDTSNIVAMGSWKLSLHNTPFRDGKELVAYEFNLPEST